MPAHDRSSVPRLFNLQCKSITLPNGEREGTITIAKADPQAAEDPALGPFLTLLEQDIAGRRQAIKAVSDDLYRHAVALVDGVEVDLDSVLPSDEG
ncbi:MULTISPECIES: type II toxin-antitoxin system PrlF family antitoxin [unclassified Methylobacterium]|jgi:hypothetical protein|uniref:type II toxin-antitoxin system PrlF family antitoxin n=1 Tax=unclassified Methylobacterium TaxID=2615210 RepID=UPI001353CC8A|nr:type II toxin-antitoxin system PrlF family antitoxin [Methylobacterium sp. 2A]MWV21055.1 hypothetical protein [Methylobacterium sp. 2A]